jgi:hypothetical protein
MVASNDRIVAVGLLTQGDLDQLGNSLSRAWPVEAAPSFIELLRAIDEADAELSAARVRSE